MIEQLAVQRVGHGRQAPRCPKIGVARAGIAARVAMRQQERDASVPRCIDDDIAKRKVDTPMVTKMSRQMEAPRLIVEMRDPKALLTLLLLGKTTGKEVAGGGNARKLERNFGTLTKHPLHLSNAISVHDEKRVRTGPSSSIMDEYAPCSKKWALTGEVCVAGSRHYGLDSLAILRDAEPKAAALAGARSIACSLTLP